MTTNQYESISNAQLRLRLEEIEKKCKNLMGQARAFGSFKYYVSHDQEHLDKVFIYAFHLSNKFAFVKHPSNDANDAERNDAERSELNDFEKFILYSSCYAHDLGMLAITTPEESKLVESKLVLEDFKKSEKVRKQHAQYTPDMVQKYLRETIEQGQITNVFTEWICSICQLHASDYPIAKRYADRGNKDKGLRKHDIIQGFPDSKPGEKFIRPALLSAILRLADALVYSKKDTLDNMDVIMDTVSLLDAQMRECDHIWKNPYDRLEEKSFPNPFANVFDYFIVQFLYKQVTEYWKHKVVKNVNVCPDILENKVDIKIEIDKTESRMYPPIKNQGGDLKKIVAAVKAKFEEEVRDNRKGVEKIFCQYGINIDLSFDEDKGK